MSNLAIRSLVALIGIPLLLFSSLQGGALFFLVVAVISTASLREYYRLASMKGASPNSAVGMTAGFLINLSFFHGTFQYVVASAMEAIGIPVPLPTFAQALVIVLILSTIVILLAETFRKTGSAGQNLCATVFGLLYVSLSLGCLIGLREIFVPAEFPVVRHFGSYPLELPAGTAGLIDRWGGMTVSLVFVSIWVCDSAAYFIGRRFGKRRLAAAISPAKTWEGAIAGFFAAVATFVIVAGIFLPYLTVLQSLLGGVIIGLFGQWGDLVESMLKRDAGVKDSSSVIPGHGGFLDRFDSVIFVSPILFLYFDYLIFAP